MSGLEAMRERVKVESLLPTEADFKRRKSYQRYHYVDRVTGALVKNPASTRAVKRVRGEHVSGYYAWRAPFRANDGRGRLTKAAEAVGAMMAPAWQAGTEHEANMRGFPGDYGGTCHGLVVERTYYRRVNGEDVIETVSG